MLSKQPKKIYRYLRFSAMTINSLCQDQLHFADPLSFNDPLDCQPIIEIDSNVETMRHVLSELIGRRVTAKALTSLEHAKLDGEKAILHAKNLGRQASSSELSHIAYQSTNPEYDINAPEAEGYLLAIEIQTELKMQYDRGVCCFSATAANPLLWSHYGDQHCGLCIGYGLDREPRPKLHKVIYGGSRTIKTSLVAKALLENDLKAQELLDRDVLLRKASPWRYEREWRLIGDKGVQDSTLALEEVIFGLRCPVAVMHAIITALDSREENVKFYKMVENRESFKLTRRHVDIEEMDYLPRTAKSGIEMFGHINVSD